MRYLELGTSYAGDLCGGKSCLVFNFSVGYVRTGDYSYQGKECPFCVGGAANKRPGRDVAFSVHYADQNGNPKEKGLFQVAVPFQRMLP